MLTSHELFGFMSPTLAQEILGETPRVLAARVEIDDRGKASVLKADKHAKGEAVVRE